MARWMNGQLSEELKNEMVSPGGSDSWKVGSENARILHHRASLPPNAGMSSATPICSEVNLGLSFTNVASSLSSLL